MTEDRNGPQLKSLRAGVSKFRKSICLTVKWHLQWSQTGWLSLDRRYEWVTRLWPILWRVMTVSSQRHNDARGLFLSSTGLTKNNSLFVGVLSNESCHSSIHSLDICESSSLGESCFEWWQNKYHLTWQKQTVYIIEPSLRNSHQSYLLSRESTRLW